MKEKEKLELYKELEPAIRAKMSKRTNKVHAYKAMKKNSIATEIGSKRGLDSTIKLIGDLFLKAAAELNVTPSDVFMENTCSGGYRTHFFAEVMETDDEFERRVKWEVENAVRRRDQDLKVAEQQKKKYEAEIEKLTRQKEALQAKLSQVK